jgi:hypothetical protein
MNCRAILIKRLEKVVIFSLRFYEVSINSGFVGECVNLAIDQGRPTCWDSHFLAE